VHVRNSSVATATVATSVGEGVERAALFDE
jgi:hypothetical protein